MDLRATLRRCTSGTPAPSSVPSIRQKRAMANCATSGPTTGERRTKPSQTRRPFSETTQARTMKPRDHEADHHPEPVMNHGVADADDDLGDQRQLGARKPANIF